MAGSATRDVKLEIHQAEFQLYTDRLMDEFIGGTNDEVTRQRVIDLLRDRYSGQDVEIICDETNNPPSVIQNNMMVVNIKLPPTKYYNIQLRL